MATDMTRDRLFEIADWALLLASLALIFVPELRASAYGSGFPLLWLAVQGAHTWHEWKQGHLSKPLGQLARNPPSTPPLRQLAWVVSTIALVMLWIAD